MQIDTVLSDAAVGSKSKKERAKPIEIPGKTYPQFNEDGTKMLDSEGKEVWGPVKMTKPKKAKVVEYQKDENGNDILDEAGNPIPVKKVRAKKPVEYQLDEAGNQILDEAGNPIPVKKARGPVVNRVPSQESAVIQVTEEQAVKIAKYTGARGQYAAMLRGGMTIGEYLQEGGDRGFLRFYVKDGACTIDVATPSA